MAKKAVKNKIAKNKISSKKIKTSNHVSVFARTTQKSELWIGEMHQDLKWMDADAVYHLLRAVLQTLRDSLQTNEAAHLASQLPLLLKGTFYESWVPKVDKPKGFSKEEFLISVKKKIGSNGDLNFDLEEGVLVALKVIMMHITQGEISDVIGSFKPTLKHFIEKIDENSSRNISL